MSKLTWINQIYDYVEFYYWEPQHLGKKTPKGKGGKKSLEKFRTSLRKQEVPLNNSFNILFHLLPQELKQKLLSSFKKLNYKHSEIVINKLTEKTNGVLQPDVTILTENYKGFIELKVDASLSSNQIYKYILGHVKWEESKKPFLFLLIKKDLVKQWNSKERKYIFDINSLLKYLQTSFNMPKKLGKEDITCYHKEMGKVIDNLEIAVFKWSELYSFLEKEVKNYESNETVKILIEDFMNDLASDKRKLNEQKV